MKSAVRVTGVAVLLLSLLSFGCGRKDNGAGDGFGPAGPVNPDLFSVVLLVSPNPAVKGETVTLDASNSHGGLVNFEFDLGDGSPVVSQAAPVTTHVYDVVNYQDTTYQVKVTACDAENRCETAGATLVVEDLPPSIAAVDTGADKRGVIGEWINLAGKNLVTVPEITVAGVPATHIELIDESNMRFRVPVAIAAGLQPLQVTFEGYPTFNAEIDVRRFALVTSARFDKAYVFDVTNTESFVDTGIRVDMTDASTIKISPEGSTAYVSNGRFNFLSTGTVQVVDLTADGGPQVIDTFDVGAGPLYDIEVSPGRELFVAGDALGIHLFDTKDPLAPANFNYTSALFNGDPLNDVAAVDIAINRAGDRVAVLNAWNAEARIFHLAGDVVTNALNPVRVDVGPATQDAAMSDDGSILYVLGGGGEGAVPPVLDNPTLSTLTAIDGTTGAVLAGPYQLSSLNGGQPVTPIPFDLAVSRSNPNKVYVTTLDEGFSELFDLLEQIFNGDLSAILDLIVFLGTDGLSFGGTWPINNASTSPSLAAPFQETFTAPTAAELLYNDKKMLQSSFRVWWDDDEGTLIFQTGATIITTATGASTFVPLETEEIGFDALFGLFQPPFSFGDVSIQP